VGAHPARRRAHACAADPHGQEPPPQQRARGPR
jgi:hypothetical protein